MLRIEIQAILHKYKGWVVFLGALVVFATFVIRDGIRENYKDFLDAVDAAEGVYLIRQDLRELHELINRTGWIVNSRSLPLTAPPTLDTRINSFQNGLSAEYEGRKLLTLTLDNASSLARKLADPKASATAGELNRAFHANEKTIDDLWDAWVRAGTQRAPTDQDKEQFLAKANAWHTESNKLTDDIYEFSDKIFEEAKKEVELSEVRYKWSNRFSYALFALAWGLALVGKLFDVDIFSMG
jgi:hypothetical protein